MIARLGLFASLLLMLVTVPRPAQARALCNAAHARAATIEAVQANYGIYAGRCVRLRGLAVRFGMSRTLYADRNAVLDQVSAPVGQTPRAIAIYPARVDHVPWRAAMVEIVGTLGTCAEAHDFVRRWMVDHPGSIMDVGGYCHGSDTDYIRPVSIRIVDSAPVVRLTEAEVAPGRRPLVEAPAGLPNRAQHEAVARALAGAIARADEQAFTKAAYPELQHDLDRLKDGSPEPWLRRDMAEAHQAFLTAMKRSPFRALGPAGSRQERVFVERETLAVSDPPERYVTCWCRDGDCTGRWPVLFADADDDPSRPYSCIETSLSALGSGGGEAIAARPARPGAGFAEPDWSRRRR